MRRRLFLGFLIVLGTFFPVSIVPEKGGGDYELASGGSSPQSQVIPNDDALGIDSIPAGDTEEEAEGTRNE